MFKCLLIFTNFRFIPLIFVIIYYFYYFIYDVKVLKNYKICIIIYKSKAYTKIIYIYI